MKTPMKGAVCYYRVSTKKQGKSGLGLEAQQYVVRDFAVKNGLNIIGEYDEVESGCNNARPMLLETFRLCKRHKAVLLIAKLDRLSRNVAFVSALLESKVAFIDVEMPDADEFFVIVKAAFNQREAKETSKRTIAALQAAKARGVELGKHGKYVLSVRNRERADNFAVKMKPLIGKLNEKGIRTVRRISRELNRRRIAPYRGKGHKWHPCTVHALLLRINKLEQSKTGTII